MRSTRSTTHNDISSKLHGTRAPNRGTTQHGTEAIPIPAFLPSPVFMAAGAAARFPVVMASSSAATSRRSPASLQASHRRSNREQQTNCSRSTRWRRSRSPLVLSHISSAPWTRTTHFPALMCVSYSMMLFLGIPTLYRPAPSISSSPSSPARPFATATYHCSSASSGRAQSRPNI